jgi:hypothetical protein
MPDNNTIITQTNCLSKTVQNSISNNNLDMSAFLDLDKLAIELSQSSTLDLLKSSQDLESKFESFARDFNNRTQLRSLDENNKENKNKKRKELYKKSTIIHQVDSKSELTKGNVNNEGDLKISEKHLEHSEVNESSFIEQNALENENLSKLILNISQNDDLIDKSVLIDRKKKEEDTDSIDDEIETNLVHKIVLNDHSHNANNLRASFFDDTNKEIEEKEEFKSGGVEKGGVDLLFSDEEHDYVYDDDRINLLEDLEDYNDNIKIVNKNEEDFIEEKYEKKKQALAVNSNRITYCSFSTTASISNSSLSESSPHMSSISTTACSSTSPYKQQKIINKQNNNNNNNNNKMDILGMLDVTHLLEYQLNTTPTK